MKPIFSPFVGEEGSTPSGDVLGPKAQYNWEEFQHDGYYDVTQAEETETGDRLSRRPAVCPMNQPCEMY